jgi:hypothetical protein
MLCVEKGGRGGGERVDLRVVVVCGCEQECKGRRWRYSCVRKITIYDCRLGKATVIHSLTGFSMYVPFCVQCDIVKYYSI